MNSTITPALTPLRTFAALALVLSTVACGDDESGSDQGTSNATNNNTTGLTSNNTSNTSNTTTGPTSNAPVVETDFPISYVALNRSEVPGIDPGGDLMITLSDNSAEVKVNPDDVECDAGCTVSDDLQWFVWQDSTTRALNVAPITNIGFDGATIDMGSMSTIGEDIRTWSVAGSRILWVSSSFEALTSELPGTNAVSLGSLGQADQTTGGIYLGPGGRRAITWTLPGLTAMELSLHSFDGASSIGDFYTFRSDGFGGTGSFYGSRERMAISPDGRYLAVITRGLTDTTPCSADTDCLATEQCGASGRCTSQRLVLNMIDFNDVDKLNGACTSDGECGTSHFCDFANPSDPNSGRCLAGRLDLGASGPNDCTNRQDGEFTEVRDTLVWSPDSTTVYLLAAEDCARFNIARTAILKTDPTLMPPTAVIENSGADWDGNACFDASEMEFDVGREGCVVDIVEFNLAPTGNTVVFSASSPKAATNFELYTIDINGSRDKEWLTDSLETTVRSLKPLEDL